MGRESSAQDRATQRIDAGGWGAFRRWAGLGALGLIAVLILAGCGPVGTQLYSTTSPASTKADEIQGLYQILFWASLVVFVAVQVMIVYTVLRFRRRNSDRPHQIHGNTRLEIAWTIIPAVILVVIFIPTARTIFDHAAAEENANFVVDVYGKQWWWEIEYPEILAEPENTESELPLVTANELRLPQGANVLINLQSNNVIHSFWVPQLSGKMDVIPGHQNRMQFTADNVGEYYGECAEFCGAAHAWMRFKVIVMPVEEFDAWVEAWRSPPPVDGNPETADVMEAPAAFGTCLACHQVEDTNAQIAPEGFGTNPIPDTGNPGPNLTLLACRETIGAGLLVNNPENLKIWLMHTDEVKPGVYMPNYFEDGAITEQQVDELVAYLSELKPEGGCPPRYPVGGVGTPVAVSE